MLPQTTPANLQEGSATSYQPESPHGVLTSAVQATPTVDEDADRKEKQFNELFDYALSKSYVAKLSQQFKPVEVATESNRNRRKIDIDIVSERAKGNIAQDCTMILDRVIDRNMAREKPAYIAFLQQAKRLVIFHDTLKPNEKHDALESAFTSGMTYNGWLTPHYKILDGAQLSGWDWAEVVYDESKPLHAAIEAVGHDRLIYSTDAEDIQNCARVLRVYMLSRTQLEGFVADYGFDKQQTQILFDKGGADGTANKPDDRTYKIVKEMFKWQGIVFVGWRCDTNGPCQDWLKKPAKLYLGVDKKVTEVVPVEQPQPLSPEPLVGLDQQQANPLIQQLAPQTQTVVKWVPVDEVTYPYVILAYEETEEKEIASKKGRAFKDKFLQEAKTAAGTGYINKLIRSHYVMASPNNAQDMAAAGISGVNSSQKLESMALKDNRITPAPINFWSPDGPDPQTLQALQYWDTKNANDQGQMTYTVQNKSSGARTTKAEVDSAKEDTMLLSSVQLSLYSGHIRECYSLVWRIVQSQALQDKVNLYGDYNQVTNPVTGDVDYTFTNNKEIVGRTFDIRAAGDVDVVQRQMLIQAMMQFWPVVQNTPIAGEFLGKLLRLQFAEDGEAWAQKLQTESQCKALLQQFFSIMQAAITNPHEIEQLGPQEKQNIMMLLQQTQQVLTGQQGAQQNGNDTTTGTGQPTGNGQPGNPTMVQPSNDQQVLSGA